MAPFPVLGSPPNWGPVLQAYIDAGDAAAVAALSALLEDMVDDYVPGTSLAKVERTGTYTTTDTTIGVDVPGFGFSLVGKGRNVEIWGFAPNFYHSVAQTQCGMALVCNGNLFDTKTQLGGTYSPHTADGPSVSVRNEIFLTNGVTYNFTMRIWGGAAGTTTAVAAAFARIMFGAIAR